MENNREYYREAKIPHECFDIEVAKSLINLPVGKVVYVAQVPIDRIKLLNAIAYFVSATGMDLRVDNDYSSFTKKSEFRKDFDFLLNIKKESV